MDLKLNAISVVVRNLEDAEKVCMNTLGLKPPEKGPYSKVTQIDEPDLSMKYAFLKIGDDAYLELVEPVRGPRVKTLEEHGEGAIYLLTFRVDNLEKLYDELKNKGITPEDWHGSPLTNRKYLKTPSGSKIFFLPRDKTCGIYFEVIERVF